MICRATLKRRPEPVDFGHLPLRGFRLETYPLVKSLGNHWLMMVNDG